MTKNAANGKAKVISNVLVRAEDDAGFESRSSIKISGEKVSEFEELFRENYAAATSQGNAAMDVEGESFNDEGFQAVHNKRKRTNSDVDISCVSEQRDVMAGTQNRFKILGDLLVEEEQSIPAVDERKNRNTNRFNTKKETFCPPIFLFNVNIPHLV